MIDRSDTRIVPWPGCFEALEVSGDLGAGPCRSGLMKNDQVTCVHRDVLRPGILEEALVS